MSDPTTDPRPRPCCPVCGAAIPADAPAAGGQPACPACLLGAGVPTGGRAADLPGAAEVAAAFPDFEILGLLGRGGMGVVWKARQRGLDRLVALKVLPKDVAGVPGFAERFQREARTLARLTHPNIVGVHEFGERSGIFFLVLEFVDGTNVRQAMREGRVAPAAALRIVPQICDALQYAHEHGVVHRDIKPENVLLDREGRVKVADFGLAKIVGADGADGTRPDLTVTGQVMGTPHYMAPEQFERPATVDHRADIYSLGVVFYEMLTGELPLGRFPPPSQKFHLDVRLDDVVLRSLEKAPERRWQRAAEVKSEVGTIEATPRPAAPAPAPAPARTSRLAIAAFTASVASIAPAVLSLARSFPRDRGLAIPVVAAAAALALFGIAGGIVAWVRIARSGGGLRGLPFAVVATLLPLVLGCVATPLAMLTVRPAEHASARDLTARRLEGIGYAGHPAPLDGWSVGNRALVRLRGMAADLPIGVHLLYSKADLEDALRFVPGVRSTDEKGRPRTDIGLPYFVLGWSAERLADLTVTTEETVGDREHWRITAVEGAGDLAYTFDVVLEDGVPKFRATPVVVTPKSGGARK